MDPTEYREVVEFLKTGKPNQSWSSKTQHYYKNTYMVDRNGVVKESLTGLIVAQQADLEAIIRKAHISPMDVHRDAENTISHIKSFYIPDVRREVRDYVDACPMCIQKRASRRIPKKPRELPPPAPRSRRYMGVSRIPQPKRLYHQTTGQQLTTTAKAPVAVERPRLASSTAATSESEVDGSKNVVEPILKQLDEMKVQKSAEIQYLYQEMEVMRVQLEERVQQRQQMLEEKDECIGKLKSKLFEAEEECYRQSEQLKYLEARIAEKDESIESLWKQMAHAKTETDDESSDLRKEMAELLVDAERQLQGKQRELDDRNLLVANMKNLLLTTEKECCRLNEELKTLQASIPDRTEEREEDKIRATEKENTIVTEVDDWQREMDHLRDQFEKCLRMKQRKLDERELYIANLKGRLAAKHGRFHRLSEDLTQSCTLLCTEPEGGGGKRGGGGYHSDGHSSGVGDLLFRNGSDNDYLDAKSCSNERICRRANHRHTAAQQLQQERRRISDGDISTGKEALHRRLLTASIAEQSADVEEMRRTVEALRMEMNERLAMKQIQLQERDIIIGKLKIEAKLLQHEIANIHAQIFEPSDD